MESIKIKKANYVHANTFFKEAYDDYIEPIALGKLNPLKTSSTTEMKLLKGFLPTDQLTIAARSGMGKTSRIIKLIDDFFNPVINPHYQDKLIVLYDSWEIAGWRNAVKFMSLNERLTYSEILDWDVKLQKDKLDVLKTYKHKFDNKRFFISEFPNSVEEWVYNKLAIQNKFPEYQIVNIIDHSRLVTRGNRETEEQLISKFMIESVAQKKKTKQINIFLSQLNRNIEQNTDRNKIGTHLPIASDIFGSDSVYQCSDFVLALHRPGYYGLPTYTYNGNIYQTGFPDSDFLMVENVLKNRNGETGVLFLEHELKYNNFKDLSSSHVQEIPNSNPNANFNDNSFNNNDW